MLYSFMMTHGTPSVIINTKCWLLVQNVVSDQCVHVSVKKHYRGDFLILLLYANGMLIVGHDVRKIKVLKMELRKSFTMKDLGSGMQILGMKIYLDRKNRKLWLFQDSYIEKVLKRFTWVKPRLLFLHLSATSNVVQSNVLQMIRERYHVSWWPFQGK